MATTATDTALLKLAQDTWALMALTAEEKGNPVVVRHGRTGRVLASTATNHFIKKTAADNKVPLPDKRGRDIIREVLRERGNVLTVARSTGNTYDIFVALKWSDEVVGDREPRFRASHSNKQHAEEQSLRAQELAGEVKTEKVTLPGPLTELSWTFLMTLYHRGGNYVIRDQDGFATPKLVKESGLSSYYDDTAASATSTLTLLEEHGLVSRKAHKHPKRTTSWGLTPKGKCVVLHSREYRSSTALVAEHLARVGSVTGPNLSRRLMEVTGLDRVGKVRSALNALESEGCVVLGKNSARWVGGVQVGSRYIPTHLWGKPAEEAKPEPIPPIPTTLLAPEPTPGADEDIDTVLASIQALTERVERLREERAHQEAASESPVQRIAALLEEFQQGGMTPLSAIEAIGLVVEEAGA